MVRRRGRDDTSVAKLYTRCLECDKKAYPSRKSAKKVCQLMCDQGAAGEDLRAYPCPFGMGFHVGHSDTTRRGLLPDLNDPRLNHLEET